MDIMDYLGDFDNEVVGDLNGESTPVDSKFQSQIRLDCYDNSENRLFLTTIIEKFKPKFYLFCHEKGKKTGKHHYQGILYYDSELSDKERVSHRNWLNRKLPVDELYAKAYYTGLKKIQKVSYTKCKVLEKLESYVIKDGKIVMTNIPDSYIQGIQQWVDKDDFKNIIQKILSMHELTHNGFCIELVKAHVEAGKCPPTRNMLYKYLLQSKRLSYASYLNSINLYIEDLA